jgi:hypothetical protein
MATGGLAATNPAAPAAAFRRKLRRPVELFFGIWNLSVWMNTVYCDIV